MKLIELKWENIINICMRHVPGLGEKFCNKPGTGFFSLDCNFLNFCSSKLFHFSVTLLFIVYYNRYLINFAIIIFLFGKRSFFYCCSCCQLLSQNKSSYFKILKLLVILA